MVRAIAALVYGRQCDQVLVVATLIFADDFTGFDDGHSTTIVRSSRSVRLFGTLAGLICRHIREYRNCCVLHLNRLNVLSRVVGTVTHCPCAYDRVGLWANFIFDGLIEHH